MRRGPAQLLGRLFKMLATTIQCAQTKISFTQQAFPSGFLIATYFQVFVFPIRNSQSLLEKIRRLQISSIQQCLLSSLF